MLSFLLYYVRLRVEVLLGFHKTAHPLGLRYRWRQWQYTQHLKRVKGREWQDGAQAEVVTKSKPKGGGKDETAA